MSPAEANRLIDRICSAYRRNTGQKGVRAVTIGVLHLGQVGIE